MEITKYILMATAILRAVLWLDPARTRFFAVTLFWPDPAKSWLNPPLAKSDLKVKFQSWTNFNFKGAFDKKFVITRHRRIKRKLERIEGRRKWKKRRKAELIGKGRKQNKLHANDFIRTHACLYRDIFSSESPQTFICFIYWAHYYLYNYYNYYNYYEVMHAIIFTNYKQQNWTS